MRQRGIHLLVAALAAILFISPARAQSSCPATDAKGVVTQVEYKNGHVMASGTWEVSGGAVGALLEFRIDNDRRQAEIRTGTSGTWSIVEGFTTCDRPLHAIRVFVYPAVQEGEGQMSVCLDRFKRSDLKQFQFPCGAQVEIEHCIWECEDSHCAGMCSVIATGGKLPYTLFQTMADSKERQEGEPSEGAWMVHVACKRGEKVSFFTRDNYGRGRPSPPAERICGQE